MHKILQWKLFLHKINNKNTQSKTAVLHVAQGTAALPIAAFYPELLSIATIAAIAPPPTRQLSIVTQKHTR
jgi:transcriptional regulatory protein LevR